jgi:hypothetical protein
MALESSQPQSVIIDPASVTDERFTTCRVAELEDSIVALQATCCVQTDGISAVENAIVALQTTCCVQADKISGLENAIVVLQATCSIQADRITVLEEALKGDNAVPREPKGQGSEKVDNGGVCPHIGPAIAENSKLQRNIEGLARVLHNLQNKINGITLPTHIKAEDELPSIDSLLFDDSNEILFKQGIASGVASRRSHESPSSLIKLEAGINSELENIQTSALQSAHLVRIYQPFISFICSSCPDVNPFFRESSLINSL